MDVTGRRFVEKYLSRSQTTVNASRSLMMRGAVVGLLLAVFAAMQPANAQTNYVLNYRAGAGVTMASFDNLLYMAFIGTDQGINIGNTSDGIHWNPQIQVTGSGGVQRSFDTPALAYFAGKLWLAWASTADSHINFAWSIDGVNFNNTILPYTSAHGISMASTANRLYMAWDAAGSNHLTQVVWTSDGVNWSAPAQYGDFYKVSPWTPTLVSAGSSLWLGLTLPADPPNTSNHYPKLALIPLLGGTNGIAPPNPATGVNAGAGIAPNNGGGLVWYAWVGPGQGQELWLTTYQFQSTTNSYQVISENPTGHTEQSTPYVVGGYLGHAYLAYVGTDGGSHVNIMQLD